MKYSLPYARLFGLCVAACIAGLDQWSKAALVVLMQETGHPTDILPFFNLVIVHNTGISFGMFAHMQAWVPLVLTLSTALIVVFLFIWLLYATEKPVIFALAFIIGGAIGNIIDRVRLGSVTDFLDFHWDIYHWPAFNIADSAIFIGVVLLVLISIVGPKPSAS